MSAPTVLEHVLAIGLGLGVPVMAFARSRKPSPDLTYDTRTRVTIYWLNSAVLGLGAGLACVAWWLAGRPLADLGFDAPRPRSWATVIAICAAFAAWYAVEAWRLIGTPERRDRTAARWRRDTPFLPVTRREVAHSFALVVGAAVFEEIIFRGFLVSYLVLLLGDGTPALVAAIMLPAVAFAVAHLYQGWPIVARIVIMAGVFGALFVLTGSIWILVGLHFAIDTIGVLIAPSLLTRGVPRFPRS